MFCTTWPFGRIFESQFLAKHYYSEVLQSASHWGLNKDGTSRQKKKIVDTAITTGEGDNLLLGYTMIGVNCLLTKDNPHLVFMYCVCHRLNIAVSHACTGIVDMMALQSVLRALYCRRPVQELQTWLLSSQCLQLSSVAGLYMHHGHG